MWTRKWCKLGIVPTDDNIRHVSLFYLCLLFARHFGGFFLPVK